MKFKVYSAETVRFGPKALIIVTYYKVKPDLKSEFFLVTPNDSLKHGKISFDCQIPKDVDFKIDKKFVLKEALNQAKIDFGEYLISQKSNNLVDVITIIKEDSSFIAHLLSTGHYESIKTIENLTECDDLKKIINIFQKITINRN
ncbi:hypothetical protein [Marinicella rhabdoformis]|uniref:hypothetical protein n=1 Tax=Marinicella rhabdoformis TaxID=2580566 RepID=UPI0012AEB615|nr:hypothetical protein [Marinicella rhabdoformis]